MAGPFIIHDQCVSRRGGGTTQGARSSARMQHHDEGVSNRMDKLVEVHADLLKRYNSLSRENERLKEVNAAVMVGGDIFEVLPPLCCASCVDILLDDSWWCKKRGGKLRNCGKAWRRWSSQGMDFLLGCS
eukprot:m.107429 g.107429  ORF g.107429 m.107429 type:complete len:130 (+) comp37299_c0_seq15:113-502(+)